MKYSIKKKGFAAVLLSILLTAASCSKNDTAGNNTPNGNSNGNMNIENLRAGINSLPTGQKNAGLALGFTLPQTYRHVLLPMAFRLVVPPLTSEFLNIFKNSAVCSTIGLLELAAQGRQLVDYTAQPYESFIAVTLLYVLINVVVMTLMRHLENKTRVPGYLGGK